MASSGWQGQKNIQTSVYPHMALNLRIDSISHSGTTLTYTGVVKVVCTSGYISWNNATVTLTGGGSKTINLNLNSSGTTSATTGTFSCTVSNVSASTTSKSVTASLSAGSVASGSASWTLSFGASASAPSGGYVNSITSTWNSMHATFGVTSNGGAALTSIQLKVLKAAYVAGVPARQYNSSSSSIGPYTVTVDNNSPTTSTAPTWVFEGCSMYYTGVYAANSAGAYRYQGPTFYTPPAPVVFSYTETGTPGEYQVTMTGDPNKNDSTYTAAQLTRSFRYKIDNGNWVNSESDANRPLDANTTVTITIPASSTATIEGWMTYQGLQSEVGTFTITNSSSPVHLYGSVSDQSKEIIHLYGSVNGRSTKITKLYASVGGVAKKIFEDT